MTALLRHYPVGLGPSRLATRAAECDAQRHEDQAKLRWHLQAHPGATKPEIAEALGWSMGKLARLLSDTTGIRREGGHGRAVGRYFGPEVSR